MPQNRETGSQINSLSKKTYPMGCKGSSTVSQFCTSAITAVSPTGSQAIHQSLMGESFQGLVEMFHSYSESIPCGIELLEASVFLCLCRKALPESQFFVIGVPVAFGPKTTLRNLWARSANDKWMESVENILHSTRTKIGLSSTSNCHVTGVIQPFLRAESLTPGLDFCLPSR